MRLVMLVKFRFWISIKNMFGVMIWVYRKFKGRKMFLKVKLVWWYVCFGNIFLKVVLRINFKKEKFEVRRLLGD